MKFSESLARDSFGQLVDRVTDCSWSWLRRPRDPLHASPKKPHRLLSSNRLAQIIETDIQRGGDIENEFLRDPVLPIISFQLLGAVQLGIDGCSLSSLFRLMDVNTQIRGRQSSSRGAFPFY